ncbi:MAG TPA: hypothetical protein DF613_02680 [Lachnospiraceae bacterium]|nr:hypothetical protein [Lachnospiraceae bacterium]
MANIYTKEFYELLDAAVTEAEKKGITVDLNMGSGWNANSQFVKLEDSMGNMALGRKTLGGSVLDASPTVHDPKPEKSIFYDGNTKKDEWSKEDVWQQGVLVAELTGEKGKKYETKTSPMAGITSAYNEFIDADGKKITYESPVQISTTNSVFVDAGDARIQNGNLTLNKNDITVTSGKQYEVIAMYYLPTGARGIDSEKRPGL